MTDSPDSDAGSPRSARGLFTTFAAAALILAVAGAFTLFRRQADARALAADTEALTIVSVAVIHPMTEPPTDELVLPGTLEAYVESPIYARTTGYLKKWYRDIGSHVSRGEPLADIDTPEIDQELSQAKAARDEAAATAALAKSTAERWVNLRKTDSVSQQEVDEKNGASAQADASLAAADANLRRLQELEGFKRVVAPFDGVITRRSVDVGTLVGAGAPPPLFQLAQTDPLRVFVSVPESDAAAMRPGLPARIEATQFPGETFDGTVARTSEAIDPASRTLRTEIDVPNPHGHLLAGGYVSVHLTAGAGEARLQVPVNALLFRAEGLRAAVVDDGGRVHLRALTIGRDFGTALEVLQGLAPTDWIVLNPPDAIEDGQQVRVERGTAPSAAPTGTSGGRP